MVDYSKWDTMEVSDSDSESGDAFNKANVTKLEGPSKVTFGGDNSALRISTEANNQSETSNLKTHEKQKEREKEKTLKEVVLRSMQSLCSNGKYIGKYGWSQTFDELVVYLFLSKITEVARSEAQRKGEDLMEIKSLRGRDVNVEVSTTGCFRVYLQENRAVSMFTTPKNSTTQKMLIFNEQLSRNTWDAPFVKEYLQTLNEAHSSPEKDSTASTRLPTEKYSWKYANNINYLNADENKREDSKLDWTLKTMEELKLATIDENEKVLVVTMKKLFPSDRIKAEWWDKFFISEPETALVDIKKLVEENLSEKKQESKAKFQKTWNEAHKRFKELVKERANSKIELDLN